MGIWRFAGAFAVVKRQGECGSKTAGMHVSQQVNIDTMLPNRALVVCNCFLINKPLLFCIQCNKNARSVAFNVTKRAFLFLFKHI
jgi:hypothetical protein